MPDEHARRLCGVLEELKTSLPTMIADRAPSRDLRVSGSILIEFFRVRTNTAPREFSNQSFRMQTGAEKRGFRCGPVWSVIGRKWAGRRRSLAHLLQTAAKHGTVTVEPELSLLRKLMAFELFRQTGNTCWRSAVAPIGEPAYPCEAIRLVASYFG